MKNGQKEIGNCYDLDVECSRKIHVLKVWSLRWFSWEALEILDSGASDEMLRSLREHSEGTSHVFDDSVIP